MEDPLLPSSSSSGGTRRRRGRADGPEGLSSQESGAVNVLVGRRVGAITSGNKYEKAAAMVDQVHTSLCLSLCPSVYVAPVSVGTWPFSATKKLGQSSFEFQECRSHLPLPCDGNSCRLHSVVDSCKSKLWVTFEYALGVAPPAPGYPLPPSLPRILRYT